MYLLYGAHSGTLNISEIANRFESAKQQWMVAYNEIATLRDGLVNDAFVHVQTQ